MEQVLRVGDRMLFSTELIQAFRDNGNRSDVVQVKQIQEWPDGTKTVWLAYGE